MLLLDEPTNHLDLAAIEWLEEWLKRYQRRVRRDQPRPHLPDAADHADLWLDRGTIRRAEIGFGGFEAWTEQVYAEEARNAERLDAKLKLEQHWLQRGVTGAAAAQPGPARQAEGDARRSARAMLGPQGTAKLAIDSDDVRTKIVIDAEHVTKRFGDRTIIRDFTLRIQRGDRIGVVGAERRGQDHAAQAADRRARARRGQVTLAKTLTGVMIDQQRSAAGAGQDACATCSPTAATGSRCAGSRKHIHGYLKDFLFEPEHGRREDRHAVGRRALAAAAGARIRAASNLLVLDEPTNDLDLETLDLLQEVIADYDGTVLIVSHDRDFLDRTVTITLGLDGSGKVDIVAGGYADWEARRRRRPDAARPRRPPRRRRRPRRPGRRPSSATRISATRSAAQRRSSSSTQRSRATRRRSPIPISTPAIPPASPS